MRELNEIETERFALASDRLAEIAREDSPEDAFEFFFIREAEFLTEMNGLRKRLAAGEMENAPEAEWKALNARIYSELLPDAYQTCCGRPSYALEQFGAGFGPLFSFLYTELRGAVVFAFENREYDLLLLMELLLQCHSLFEGGTPEPETMRSALYWYCQDYTTEFVLERTEEQLVYETSFARKLILESDLSNPAYLYRFGEYVTDNERKLAGFLAGLPQEEIDRLAGIWTEGYRLGFLAEKKDLGKKKSVAIRYRLGFERIVKAAVLQFRKMGLESVLYRPAVHAVSRRGALRIGYYGAVPNPQFEYDHRDDAALFLDERFVNTRLTAIREAYEEYEEEASVHGGPAVMDVFGETPFVPEEDPASMRLSAEQRQLQARLNTESARITNRFIKAEERSFTIIAWPVPEIGDDFESIFRETAAINGLDNDEYRTVQQHLIDALDQGDSVRIFGADGNETDLTVRLHQLTDPARQTNFENCVADVNIPVGEVFTSPVLEGTCGLLHVSSVYLGDFLFKDLKIRLEDGMITEYSCRNFESEDQNRSYIEDNILFHHDSLPIGEFAIGTNTLAYRMGKVFGIDGKLPILIAEKTGPHFAFGDTCYSFQEDLAVYNPDGKEIIARDNSRSLLRKTDPSRAYFGCHTDVTLPYEELGGIAVHCPDGREIPLLENGRFVLEGCESLNGPLSGLPDMKNMR